MVAYDNAVQSTLQMARAEVDMVVVPGTVATYTRKGTSCFLKALDRPYLIDPRTPIFQFGRGAGLRPAERTLARAHGEEFAEYLASTGSTRDLNDEGWLRAATAMAHYQRDYGQACPPGRAPTTILSAYLMVEPSLGETWALSLAMLRETRAAVPDQHVTVAAALASPRPSEPRLDVLDVMLADLAKMGGLTTALMWLDGFDEYDASAETVAQLARCVTARSVPALFNLYGGYLSLVLHHFGLAGASSGIAYGHGRAAREQAPSDVPPPGYYVPLVHAPVSPLAAEDLIRRVGPRARCSCETCQEWAGSSEVARLTSQQLRLHFAHARAAERAQAATWSLDALIEDLVEAEHVVDEAVRQAPARANIRSVPYRHLAAWAHGLRSAAGVPDPSP